MEQEHLIPVTLYCAQQAVDISFVQMLQEYGLVEITTIAEERFIKADELVKLAQYSRMHYDLEINPPGIDAIEHLLARIRSLQEENRRLQTRLRLYEGE